MENPQVDKVKKESSKKRLSVERIYQKKTQLEHIILRPDSYIGSVEPCSQNMWIWDGEKSAIISKSITYTPGLYKIFDEIIGKYLPLQGLVSGPFPIEFIHQCIFLIEFMLIMQLIFFFLIYASYFHSECCFSLSNYVLFLGIPPYFCCFFDIFCFIYILRN